MLGNSQSGSEVRFCLPDAGRYKRAAVGPCSAGSGFFLECFRQSDDKEVVAFSIPNLPRLSDLQSLLFDLGLVLPANLYRYLLARQNDDLVETVALEESVRSLAC